MKKSRNSWYLLHSLSPKEMKGFEKFLIAKSSSRQSQDLKAFLSLKKANKEEADSVLQKVFPKTKNNDRYLRTIHSRLGTKIKEFLAIQVFKGSPMKDIFLLEALSNRNIPGIFHSEFNKLQNDLEISAPKSSAYYQSKYLLYTEKQNYLIQHKTKPEAIPFAEALEAFDYWWIHQKLSLACYAREQKKLRDNQIESVLIDELIDLIRNDKRFKDKKALQIYLKYYDFLENENPEDMPELEKQIKEGIRLFDKDERKNFFILIYNFYARRYKQNKSRKNALKLIDHFQWGIDDEVLFKDEEISWDFYRNLLNLCLNHDFLDQALFYLENWQKRLKKKDQKELVPYFNGLISFRKAQWGDARRNLNLKFTHPLLKITASFTYLQAEYEEGEINRKAFLRKLSSIKSYLEKSEHPRIMKMKSSYLARNNFFRQLILAKSDKDFFSLKERIEAFGSFSEKDWILEKVDSELLNYSPKNV